MAVIPEMDQLYYRTILDGIPLPVLLVDDDMVVIDLNKAGQEFLDKTRSSILRKRGGEAFNCVHSADSVDGCGHGPECGSCIMRNSVSEASFGRSVLRQPAKAETVNGTSVREIDLMVSTSPIRLGGQDLALLVLEDVSEIVHLRSLIPMCANCKRIRDDAEYWQHVEIYLRDRLGVDVTHSLCNECIEKLYPEHSENILKKLKKRSP